MRIAICDDESIFRNEIKLCIKNFLISQGKYADILEFKGGEELLTYCTNSKSERIDLLFLDIEMPQIDGLEVKQSIEHSDKIFRIVFVTSHDEVMHKAFGVKVISFLKKPVADIDIQNQITNVIKDINRNTKISLDEQTEIFLEDLEYINSEGNYCYVHLKNRQKPILIVKQLGELEKTFENMPVIRVHKSYLVNMINVVELSNQIKLRDNNELIPVGRKYLKSAREAFLEFKKKQMLERM